MDSNPNKISIASWVLCLLGGIVLVWLSFAFLLAGHRFESIYKDLGIALPGITALLLYISRSWLWLLLPATAVVQVYLETVWHGRVPRLVFNVLYFVLCLAAMIAVVAGFFLPFIIAIDSISAQDRPN